jgi:hypothetical protein
MAVIKGGFEIVKRAMLKELMKRGDDGIMLTLPKNELVDLNARITMDRLIKAGIDPESLTSPDQVLNVLENINNQMMKNTRVLSGDEAAKFLNKAFSKKGEVVKFPQKRTFKEEIEAMKKSGDLVDKDNMVISEKITDREMFKDASKRFKKKEEPIDPDFYDGPFDNEAERMAEIKMSNEGFIADSVARITSMEPVAAMKEANKIIKREGIYKNLNKDQSQAILKGTDDWINQRDLSDRYDYKKNRPFRDDPDFDPDDPDYLQRMKDEDADNFATGGRAGHYTGGMVDVEPSLSDIGHGSDALMARTRLVSPNSQATTSTGLNYLLAEDNDNIRVPFSAGGGGRRAFLKLMAALTGGVAAAKTGILGLGGKESGKQVAKEVVKKAGGANEVPPYFFKLVDKIKTLGDDTMATQDKAIAKKYKDYVMEEDFAGNITIIKKNMDDPYPEEVIMSYKVDDVDLPSGKGMAKVDEYEEFTIRPDGDGKMKDIEGGVPDEVVQEGTMFEDNITDFGKADGGRIDFSAGGLANVLSRLGITGSSRRFLEKAFGKENFENMIKNDPQMHRGLLEVVEMFRNRDKEGLKMYMQKFLPHMDDATVEEFIVGTTPDIEGLTGQLTRLGSGRDYSQKLQMMKKADEVKKLQNFDIKNVTKNAEGGRIGFSGGGIFRAIIAKAAAAKGMKPYEFIKVTSYKSLPPEVKMFMSADDFAKLKSGQEQMYSNYIDMAKTRKNFQQEVEGGKTTPAKPLFENMEKMMDQQSYVPKTVTADDIAEMELMVKNRFNKGRKDNAQGGLQTMLGE